MTTQIVSGMIEPSWVLGTSVLIVGFFMIRTLVKIESRLDRHDKQMNNITMVQIKMLSKLGVDDDYFEDLLKDLNK